MEAKNFFGHLIINYIFRCNLPNVSLIRYNVVNVFKFTIADFSISTFYPAAA